MLVGVGIARNAPNARRLLSPEEGAIMPSILPDAKGKKLFDQFYLHPKAIHEAGASNSIF